MKRVSLQDKVEALSAAMEAGLDHEEVLQNRLNHANEMLKNCQHSREQDSKFYTDTIENNRKEHNKLIAEKTARITQLGEEVAQLKEKINVANEMKNITLELARRFTSLQITSLGTQTTPHGQVMGENTPATLRVVK